MEPTQVGQRIPVAAERQDHTVGNVATFAASDWARTMTAPALNITAGALVD